MPQMPPFGTAGTIAIEQSTLMRLRYPRFARKLKEIHGLQPSSTTAQAANNRLDVFRDCEKPPASYKKVGFLTDGGRVFEQNEIEATFMRRAKEMGGDALVLLPPVKSIEAPPGWGLFDTFLYEAVVVAYE